MQSPAQQSACREAGGGGGGGGGSSGCEWWGTGTEGAALQCCCTLQISVASLQRLLARLALGLHWAISHRAAPQARWRLQQHSVEASQCGGLLGAPAALSEGVSSTKPVSAACARLALVRSVKCENLQNSRLVTRKGMCAVRLAARSARPAYAPPASSAADSDRRVGRPHYI